jgi:AcrR family transcriptional regulator
MPRVVDNEQRRVELTEATARVIARSGVGAATMREIAAEAGWTTGALTHYFTDKHELLLATFQASLAARRARRADRAQASALDRLRATLEGALPLDDDRRRHWLVTLACCTQASGDEQLAAAQRQAYREFRDHVGGLVRETGIGDGDDARSVAERLIAIVDGVAIQALFDPSSWPAERQLAAIAAPPTAPTAGLWSR